MSRVPYQGSYYRPSYMPQNTRKIPPIIYVLIMIILGGFVMLFIIGSIFLNLLINRPEPEREPPVLPASSYPVMGKPTISAELINEVLERYDSPASGKGQALYDYGVQYGIDPAFALAFFLHESTFGTRGVARETLSLGNIRATEGYQSHEGYRKYNSWEEGFEDWYKLIRNLYVRQWQLYTVDQIIPVYAPKEDNNDEGAYIASVKSAVDKWRSGRIRV